MGGGYVILPLLQSEIAEKKQWLTEDELCEYYAISQSIPGIIAANVSVFTGYKLNGQKGALAAILGVITPAFLAIVALATLVEQIAGVGFVKDIFWGVGIGVIMLIFLATKEMLGKSIIDKFTCAVFISAFILSAGFKFHPAIIVILAIAAGIIYRKKYPLILTTKEEDKE